MKVFFFLQFFRDLRITKVNQEKEHVDDQVIILNSEDELAHKLNKLICKYGITISTEKLKTLVFYGRESIRRKKVINNKIMQQPIRIFNYPHC
jgi:hypothetical protein